MLQSCAVYIENANRKLQLAITSSYNDLLNFE